MKANDVTTPNKRRKVSVESSPDILEQWSISAVEAEERSALTSLYDQLNGKNWNNATHWNTNEPLSNWYGIRVNESGRVAAIELSRNNLAGRLEHVVADIVRLTELSQL
jgi:hypothetical protein